MSFCAKCGNAVTDAMAFCGKCGNALKKESGSTATAMSANSGSGNITDEEYTAFVQQKAEVYIPKFKQFTVKGMDNFTATWHWPAFFAGFSWLLYRKLYMWAAIVFVTNLIPYVAFVSSIVLGLSAHYLYFKHTREKINALKTVSNTASAADLALIGGVNKWVVVVSIVLGVVVLLGIAAAIVIPIVMK